MKKLLFAVYLGAIIIGTTVLAMAAAVSENDSSKPQGIPVASIIEGFGGSAQFEGDITPTGDSKNPYHEWVGGIIENAMRDPAFFATVNTAYEDYTNFINSLDAEDRKNFLAAGNLPDDTGDDGLLPVAANLCLHCHTLAGWLEDYPDEPLMPAF